MTTQAGTDRTRDYIAYMRCDAGDSWMPKAVSQVSSWLQEKQFDVDLSEWGDHRRDASLLAVRPIEQGGSSDLHIELVEDGGQGGQWRTELVLHDEPGGADWISLEVSNDAGRFVAVPRLARYLMQVLPLGDSSIDFTDKPQTFGTQDLDRLLALLGDQSRHGLVFVAGTAHSDLPFDAFGRKVAEWAREVYGLAQVVVLDPDATTEFERRVGSRFAAPPWTIRTYHPGVVWDDGLDARRHRILGTLRLANQRDHATARLLGDIARQQAAARPVDPALLRVRRRLLRLETARLVDAVSVPEPSVLSDVPQLPAAEVDHEDLAGPQVELDLIHGVLGVDEITEEYLRSLVDRVGRREAEQHALQALSVRVEDLQTSVERAEDENRELLTALDEAQLGAEIARLDLDDRDGRIRWLESRLKDEGDFEAAYLEVPDEFRSTRPANFAELLERVDELPHVTFTGDPSEVERLNQVDTNDAALRTAWDAVLVLHDYVRARRDGVWDQGLDQFLAATPAGYGTFPPGKFGETETRTTMRSFGAERVFPVPSEVDPRGQVTMKAHFKLARIGMASPRMYVHDGHPDTPHIFIGYLGTHLTNTHTR